MKDNIKVIINEVEGECVTAEGYKTVARGLLNVFGKDTCKLLVNQFNKKSNKDESKWHDSNI